MREFTAWKCDRTIEKALATNEEKEIRKSLYLLALAFGRNSGYLRMVKCERCYLFNGNNEVKCRAKDQIESIVNVLDEMKTETMVFNGVQIYKDGFEDYTKEISKESVIEILRSLRKVLDACPGIVDKEPEFEVESNYHYRFSFLVFYTDHANDISIFR